MTDKEKIRQEVEKLKSNLIHGACSSQVAMETRCKEEAYNEVLAILDTMQEESVSKQKLSNNQRTGKIGKKPVSEDLENAAVEWFNSVKYKSDLSGTPINAFMAGAKWQKEHLMKDAVDGEIGYWNLRWLSVNADLPRTVAEGDKVKVILIKEK